VNQLLDRLLDAWKGPLHLNAADIGLACLCALICGFVISETYRRTHRGVDYARSFLQVLVIITIIVAFVTLVVGDDLARAFTLVGALSVGRFRTAVKEARDLGFIFWAVGAGMGAGVRLYGLTILFSAILAGVVWILTRMNYGVRDRDVRTLRVRLDSGADLDAAFAEPFELLAQVERLSVGLVRAGTLYEVVYRIRLAPGADETQLLTQIRAVCGDNPVTLSRVDESDA